MNIFLGTEISILILFLITLVAIYKNDKKSLWFFLFAIIYAVIFENINIYLSQNVIGGYFYNPNFKLFILETPLFIILSWAMIIYSAQKITLALPIKKFTQPFIAALLVLLIDLSLDAIAIRLNFWTWRGYSLTEGFWGVPANNFLGWLLIAFTFFFVYQNLERFKKEIIRLILTCFLSLTSFLVIFGFLTKLEFWLKLDKNTEFILLICVLILFLLPLTKKQTPTIPPAPQKNLPLSFFLRWCFHFFSLVSILYFKIYQETPLFLVWTLLLIFLEILAKKSLTCGKLCDKIIVDLKK